MYTHVLVSSRVRPAMVASMANASPSCTSPTKKTFAEVLFGLLLFVARIRTGEASLGSPVTITLPASCECFVASGPSPVYSIVSTRGLPSDGHSCVTVVVGHGLDGELWTAA